MGTVASALAWFAWMHGRTVWDMGTLRYDDRDDLDENIIKIGSEY